MKAIGRYNILEELGRGAMGVVYKASDPTIDRLVAIKVLSLTSPTEEGVPDARSIFRREARAAGRLLHPGIVTIHDALEDPETQNSYIVMEFVPGRTLESVLASGPALEPKRALEIIRQVADALDYAHRQNVIHRDLKPANILLTEDGRAKITDFGIAKILAGEKVARTAAVMGTPSYMSPEQITGGEVDARTDLFSLGILLYMMLTGRKPFEGDPSAVMFKIVYEDPVPPSRARPQLSAPHDYVALRCLAKDREKRYATARDFLNDLDDIQEGRPPRSESQFPLSELRAGEATLISGVPVLPAPAKLEPPPQKHVGRAALRAGAGLMILAALVGVTWWRSRHRPPATTSLSPTLATAPSAAPSANPLPASPPNPTPAQSGTSRLNQPPSPSSASGEAGLSSEAAGQAPSETASNDTEPAASTAAEHPASTPAVSGIPLPKSSRGATAPTSAASKGKSTELVCRHDLEEGKLMVLIGRNVLDQWPIRGRKKGRFLGIRGGYTGTVSHYFKVPAGTRELTIRVVSKDGSFDLSSEPVPVSPAAGSSPILQVIVSGERLSVNWKTRPPKS